MTASIHFFPGVTKVRPASDALPHFDAMPIGPVARVDAGNGTAHLEFIGDFEPARLRKLAQLFVHLAMKIELDQMCEAGDRHE